MKIWYVCYRHQWRTGEYDRQLNKSDISYVPGERRLSHFTPKSKLSVNCFFWSFTLPSEPVCALPGPRHCEKWIPTSNDSFQLCSLGPYQSPVGLSGHRNDKNISVPGGFCHFVFLRAWWLGSNSQPITALPDGAKDLPEFRFQINHKLGWANAVPHKKATKLDKLTLFQEKKLVEAISFACLKWLPWDLQERGPSCRSPVNKETRKPLSVTIAAQLKMFLSSSHPHTKHPRVAIFHSILSAPQVSLQMLTACGTGSNPESPPRQLSRNGRCRNSGWSWPSQQ